ncbi:MAG: hypothetical protein KAF91_10445 [Nostoc sp. TH1S01]|nr:hypothetical protein [Nostoc sp. TH1S01]
MQAQETIRTRYSYNIELLAIYKALERSPLPILFHSSNFNLYVLMRSPVNILLFTLVLLKRSHFTMCNYHRAIACKHISFSYSIY